MGLSFTNARRAGSFASGCLMLLCAGTLYGFSAYSDVLKSTLGFSGKEVNLVVSVGLFGQMALQPISGFIGDRLGPRAASLWGVSFMFIGYAGVWAQVSRILPPSSALSAFLYLIAGYGGGTYSVTCVANVKNFPVKVRAIVSGLLTMFMGLSAAMFTLLYKYQFSSTNDLRTFLAVYMVVLPGVGLLGVLLQERLPYSSTTSSSNSEYDWLIHDRTPEEIERAKVEVFGKYHAGRTGKQLLFSMRYTVLWIALLLCCSSVLVFLNNVKLMFMANNVDESDALVFITMTSYFNCFGRLLTSTLFYLVNVLGSPKIQALFNIPFFMALMATGSFVMSMLLVMQGPMIIRVASCLMPMTYGGWFGALPTYIVQRFGEPAMGFNYGITSVGVAIGNVVFGQVSGAIYDYFAHGDSTCVGPQCYRFTFMFCSMAEFLGLVCILFVWFRETQHSLRDISRASLLQKQGGVRGEPLTQVSA
eukprot:m51a1_g5610 hypothetical protein (475) ;mRNA; f:714657-716504